MDNAPPKFIFWAKCGKVTFQDLVKFKSSHFIPLVEKHLLSTEFPGILLLKFGIGTVYRSLLIHCTGTAVKNATTHTGPRQELALLKNGKILYPIYTYMDLLLRAQQLAPVPQLVRLLPQIRRAAHSIPARDL